MEQYILEHRHFSTVAYSYRHYFSYGFHFTLFLPLFQLTHQKLYCFMQVFVGVRCLWCICEYLYLCDYILCVNICVCLGLIALSVFTLYNAHMTDHAGPRRYECNPVFQIVTSEICNLVLKFHNPMKICGTR